MKCYVLKNHHVSLFIKAEQSDMTVNPETKTFVEILFFTVFFLFFSELYLMMGLSCGGRGDGEPGSEMGDGSVLPGRKSGTYKLGQLL